MSKYDPVEERFLESLNAYASKRRPTGGFLRAVLENDLMEAMGRGDDDALENLSAICMHIYNNMPASCHGSKERVATWLKGES